MSDSMKTFVFALVLSLICSSMLAGVSTVCQPRYVENKELERKTKTLSVLGFEVGEKDPAEKINALYRDSIQEVSVKDQAGEERFRAYVYRDKTSGQVKGMAFPVHGKGLWGPIHGMAAVSGDERTILGVRFFDHEETPGLGAEIGQVWFQKQFEGRPVLDENGKVAIHVVMPKAAKTPYEIDGISGATITGRGITELMQRELRDFLEYYKPEGAGQ